MAKQVAPERHEICEVVATLLAHAGGMNERTDSRRLYQLNDRYWRAPWKGGAFQWVQTPPGNRSSRKQSEQSWR
jgi:hypothetical protein